ncbi:hypothetical protein OG252_08290 [Streptomyces sp. NBC_01352]|uniref:Uncharacterized protein n=1 Tax=Streptomyces plumbiresistens TaxID=511811 RepID=A0ABP7S9U7_9ACTN|nr:hypothetical protein [Streptomyces sp. NBC_01352]
MPLGCGALRGFASALPHDMTTVDATGTGVRRHRDGTRAVLEAVGHMPAYEMAGGDRPGRCPAVRGRARRLRQSLRLERPLTGGPAPVRACIDEPPLAVLDGTVEPGRVLARAVPWRPYPRGTGPWTTGRR